MFSQVKLIALVLVASLLAVFGAAAFLSKAERRNVDPSLIIGDARLATGSAQPKVTIVEFSDFQCPACRASAAFIHSLVKENAHDVRLVYRHFPLTSIHDHAFEAAKASEIAAGQGKFWKMHDLLFERQDEWASSSDVKSRFASYAEELGLDRKAFLDAWGSSQHEQRIRDDMRDGRSLRISSTPTVYMNGRLVSLDQLSEMVAAELEQ